MSRAGTGHAGVVSPGEVKNLRIEIVAGKTSYRGSARHGIVSESYGQWVGSYEFLDKPEPARPGSLRMRRAAASPSSCGIVTSISTAS